MTDKSRTVFVVEKATPGSDGKPEFQYLMDGTTYFDEFQITKERRVKLYDTEDDAAQRAAGLQNYRYGDEPAPLWVRATAIRIPEGVDYLYPWSFLSEASK